MGELVAGFFLFGIFALYIVCAMGADQNEYRRDRERRGIRDDD